MFEAILAPLTLTRFRVTLEFEIPTPWSPLAGVILRGAWGSQIHHHAEANRRLFKPGLPQPVMFQPLPAAGIQDLEAVLTGLPAEIEPFSLHELRHHIAAHYVRRAAFDVVFVGEMVRYAEFALSLFVELEAAGLGRTDFATKERISFRVLRVCHLDSNGVETDLMERDSDGIRWTDLDIAELPPTFGLDEARHRAETLAPAEELAVEVLTPMLLVRQDDERKRVLQKPLWDEFVGAIRARAKTLSHFYPDDRIQREDLPPSAPVEREVNMGWWEHRNYIDRPVSSRSPTGRDRIQGVVGTFVAENSRPELLPLLAYGEQFGLGKNTISGMGSIRLSGRRRPVSATANR